jgi:hypothetical protein
MLRREDSVNRLPLGDIRLVTDSQNLHEQNSRVPKSPDAVVSAGLDRRFCRRRNIECRMHLTIFCPNTSRATV